MKPTKGRRPARPRRNDSPSRKRSRYLEPNDVVDIDDIEFLRRFVTEFGKIVPARVTGVTAQQQRQIRLGVCRARNMGLLA
jgi:small subunit ribosomal protein S18